MFLFIDCVIQVGVCDAGAFVRVISFVLELLAHVILKHNIFLYIFTHALAFKPFLQIALFKKLIE
jgi:hypothetical protein